MKKIITVICVLLGCYLGAKAKAEVKNPEPVCKHDADRLGIGVRQDVDTLSF
jgi:hypothetical protein